MYGRVKSRIPRNFLKRLAFVWTIVLIAGSLSSGETKTAIGTTRIEERPGQMAVQGAPFDLKHRMFHWISFGATAYLYIALAESAGAEALAALGAAALGLAIETAQYGLYWIRFEWDDVRDDTIAVAVMYVFMMGYGRWSRRTKDGEPRQ